MTDRKLLLGKFVWFEHVSRDAKKAQAFYKEVLGWTVQPFPMGPVTYEMVYAGGTMIGGYAAPKADRQPPHWIAYVSVGDVDGAVKIATANGGKIVEAPYDIPQVGRAARIADPQGAEICLFTNASGDPADTGSVAAGHFVWNELHTSDVSKAIAFYGKVVGFSHRDMDMGPGGTYHVLSAGGVERGGVTHWLAPGAPPHWLPYVHVEDVDGTIARTKKHGGSVTFGPEDIPGVGRLGGLVDPTGAALAFIKPNPRES
jgi:predicted enzyme related to lactoylglutathione lyase